MLDVALLRAEPSRVKAALARRGVDPAQVEAAGALDARWLARREVAEALRLRRRRISDELARARWDRAGQDVTTALENLARQVARELRSVEAELADLEATRNRALAALPNLPMSDVPDEAPPAAGAPPWTRPFAPLPHWHIIELAALAERCRTPGPGRGFLVWRGPGARLVRAMTDFMLDVHTGEFGYVEVRVPALATRGQLVASAHLPAMEKGMYHVISASAADEPAAAARGNRVPADTDLFLAPRAEPHLASMYTGQVLQGHALPVRLAAAGPAFRKGSHGGGADARGLLRLHEFQTVELYAFCRPDQAEDELALAVRAAETVLERLQVPWRRCVRPASRLSHAAARTFDLEVWAPGTGRWLAVASISTFTDYQARRSRTRCRDLGGRIRLVHTVGGAAVAVPRLLAAILENGQQADGSVRLPPALAARLGAQTIGP